MRRNKNNIPVIALILLLWLIFGSIIGFLRPREIRDLIIPGSFLIFFVFLYITVFLTGTVIFANYRRGIILSTGVTLFLILRLLALGNILNFILIFGACVAIERYFSDI